MVEVEIKLPIKNKEIVEKSLEKLGFVKAGLVREEDVYFDNESSRIRENGEALRVRKVTNLATDESETRITYKGKKLDQVSMTRKELETGVSDAEVCIQILEAIGYQAIPPEVVKTRQEYTFENVTACIDQVQNLGDFLELEILIEEDENKENALQQIEIILRRLGYTLKDTTRTSYLSMLQLDK